MRRIILAVSGGGIRGILPAALLAAVEQSLGAPIAGSVDMLAGTSTGGILAAGLWAGVPASALLGLYTQNGGAIFRRSSLRQILTGFGLWGPRYSAHALEKALFGVLTGKRLSDPSPRARLLVPTYCIRLPRPMDLDHDGVAESASALFFKSWESAGRDFRLVDVCRATSAAPGYFPPARICDATTRRDEYLCIDGGIHSNNPAADALAEARKLWPGDPVTLISIGTGSKVQELPVGNWGLAYWATRIVNVLMDGTADAVSYQCTEALGSNFVRCEIPILGANEAMDDASPSNISALSDLAAKFTAQNLNRVCLALGAGA